MREYYTVVHDRNHLPESKKRWIVHNVQTGKDVMAFDSQPEASAMAVSLNKKMREVFGDTAGVDKDDT